MTAKLLREFVGYDSAHEHCEECKECLFGEDSVVKLDDSYPGCFKHSSPERCEIVKSGYSADAPPDLMQALRDSLSRENDDR